MSRCIPVTLQHARAGQRALPHASEKRHDLLNLHAVCPVFYKCLFYFAMSKNHQGLTDGMRFAPILCSGATSCTPKNPTPQKSHPAASHKTTLCDCAIHYSTSITSPLLPSFPCLFFFVPGYQVHWRDSDQYKTVFLV